MPSQVDIANFALLSIGEDTITSVDDPVTAAKFVKLRFDSLRDATLRSHVWGFARTRASLARISPDPPFGWSRAFALPTDFLRLWILNPDANDPYHIERHAAQRALLTDASSADIIYIARVTDTEQFDPLFVEALAARLAWEMALAITGDANLAALRRDEYAAKLAEARSIDGQENPSLVLEFEDFLEARRGSGSYRSISSG